jgi:hypothetical protein
MVMAAMTVALRRLSASICGGHFTVAELYAGVGNFRAASELTYVTASTQVVVPE